MKHFAAPWSRSLVVLSTLSTVICLIAAFMLHAHWWLSALPIALLVGCALFTIRGYSLTEDTILIHRLLWSTRLPIASIQAADFQPDAMHRAWRIEAMAASSPLPASTAIASWVLFAHTLPTLVIP